MEKKKSKLKTKSEFLSLASRGTIHIINGTDSVDLTARGTLSSTYLKPSTVHLEGDDSAIARAREILWHFACSVGSFGYREDRFTPVIIFQVAKLPDELVIEQMLAEFAPPSLEEQLAQAVATEDYEQAAKLRDQINKQQR